MKTNPQYKKSGAMFMVGGFGVVILAISAVTTFSFFSTYFSSIFPTGMLGPELASLLAGGAGVILFDIASVYWLHTFLNHAETSEQRGIALIMLIVTFVGAAGASIAQLGLAASGDVALDPATRQSIANASVWTVIIGVVSNFGANIAYGRFSLASKQAVMEADRRDMVQDAEDEQARLLDGLIAQNVKELITAEAGKLAQEQAKRVVAAFRAREMAKYAGVENGSKEPGFHTITFDTENGPWSYNVVGDLKEAKATADEIMQQHKVKNPVIKNSEGTIVWRAEVEKTKPSFRPYSATRTKPNGVGQPSGD